MWRLMGSSTQESDPTDVKGTLCRLEGGGVNRRKQEITDDLNFSAFLEPTGRSDLLVQVENPFQPPTRFLAPIDTWVLIRRLFSAHNQQYQVDRSGSKV